MSVSVFACGRENGQGTNDGNDIVDSPPQNIYLPTTRIDTGCFQKKRLNPFGFEFHDCSSNLRIGRHKAKALIAFELHTEIIQGLLNRQKDRR